ncbi:lamin tail domain-containing protein [Hymenobacter sp. 15J16-1T3B]|uniref:lamin tail domain-containing protein n=1 Tax=Hymenobacter sp. 15J16-1T3B TaxID=2886941 RepID=UPI001D125447|nr:lamin tail domain-containing protein [Hymenobacter sp. 15J16-1T3B]MCC3157847.1 lamin tail domain-containing protein [Hymenobacter sp. 15J16-1T3B]
MLLRVLRALSLVLATAAPAAAQLNETFTDGDFTQNPAWTGDATGFQVTSQQLQSNGPAVTGTQLQLATPVQAVTGTTWEFWANLRLATSSGNLADVWLISEQADLKAAGNRGYFVRLGGTPDEVALFRKDASGAGSYVINGADGTLASTTNNLVRVRVTRTPAGVWTLERDLTGGTNYVSEGTATDNTYQRSQYLGVLLTYSSANNRAFTFDDFRVSDQAEPQLSSATPQSGTTLDVLFNEPVAANIPASAFRLSSGATASSAARDAQDPGLVHLTFAGTFPLGPNTLEARNVVDLYGNVATGPLTAPFVYNGTPVLPGPNQLLITEILADETPQVGLPASEFIEIYNPSATNPLDLAGVRLTKPGSTSSAIFPAGSLLLPGEYAVVCGNTRTAQFASYGKVFGLTNFPALGNTGDQLLLRARDGRQLFEVNYADTWYRDNSKKDGGWTLEMVDTGNPCGGADNWLASTDASGGTPARANAVRAANADRTAPALLRAVAATPTLLRLTFAEKLDSTLAANPALYSLGTGGPAVQRAVPVAADFRAVELTLAAPLTPSQPYALTVQRATDCVGNGAGPLTSATLVLPSAAAVNDIVINEVLFNPRTEGFDFVELLNRSNKYIDLQGWQIGRVRPDSIAENRTIISEPYVLAPGQLVVLSQRPDVVQAQYASSSDPAAFLPTLTLPSYPDDAGIVTLINGPQRIDRFDYNESLHLALLDTRDGVSLERLRPDGPSRGANFHSAAGSVGYATPGRRNSQFLAESGSSQQFAVEPEVFTPDDDGQQDYTTLSYRLDGAGYAASVTVYDAVGRLTRRLVRNESLATTGFFQWDGLTDARHKAPVGYYVLHIELYKPGGGAKKEYKKTVVVGARL